MRANLRIALYSHDTMGLGHIRRNQLISHTLAASSPCPDFFMISGAAEATSFNLPSTADLLVLPSFVKDENGEYRSKSNQLPIEDLVQLRRKTICSALEAFAPDVFIVDKVPRGTLGELDAALEMLRVRGRTLCILGLRDVLDEASVVQKEWAQAESDRAIRDYYDAIWIYGDRSIFSASREYHFTSDTLRKVTYTGYQDQRPRLNILNGQLQFWNRFIPDGPYVLCLVGGGQDGALLAENFAKSRLPAGMNAVLITGPYMPHESLHRIHESINGNSRFSVIDFVPETGPFVKHASKVISMGGYNTVCEVLSFEKPALVVPRVVPRKEQLIRAQCFQEKGLLDLLHWEDVSPDALTGWIRSEQAAPSVHDRVDFNGLSRMRDSLTELVEVAFGVRSA